MIGRWFMPSWCLVCGKGGKVLCDDCAQALHPRLRQIPHPVYSLARHVDLWRAFLLRAKYGGDRRLAKRMGQLFHLKMPSTADMKYVAVPPRRVKEKEGHLEVVAKVFARCRNLQYCQPFRWRREVRRQTSTVSEEQRLAFPIDAFECDFLHGGCVVIDDVLTTGATMRALHHSLFQSGCDSVMAFTFTEKSRF